MNQIRILLLDNDESNINLITKYFGAFGAEVFFTSNTDDAVESLEIKKPKLSLVSLKLVHANNWSFFKKTKESLMPIIGLVEKDQSFRMKEGQVHGINAYLAKPLEYFHLRTYLPLLLGQVWAIKKRVNPTNERRSDCDRRIVEVSRRWYDRLSQVDNVANEEMGLINIGPLSVCSKKKCIVRNDGKNVRLTPKEYKLLLLLFRNKDKIVSIDDYSFAYLEFKLPGV